MCSGGVQNGGWHELYNLVTCLTLFMAPRRVISSLASTFYAILSVGLSGERPDPVGPVLAPVQDGDSGATRRGTGS